MADLTAAVPTASADALLRRTLRGVWPGLPALAVGSAACCLAAVVVILVTPGVTPLSALVAAALIGPFLIALVAVGNRITGGESATIRSWAADLRACALAGAGHCLVAGLATSLFVVAVHAWNVTGSVLWIPSVGMTGATALATSVVLLAVLPLRAGTTLRGRRVWLSAAGLVVRQPVAFLAVACAIGLGIFLAATMTASLLLIVPGIAVIIDVGAVWTTVGHGPDRL